MDEGKCAILEWLDEFSGFNSEQSLGASTNAAKLYALNR